MAQIREYTAPTDKLQASDLGETSLVRAATRINALGDETARTMNQNFKSVGTGLQSLGEQISAHEGFQEINGGMANGQQQLDNRLQRIQERMKSPDAYKDPDLMQKIMSEEVTPGWSDWVGSFKTPAGKKWAQQYSLHAQSHLAERVSADMSGLSVQALTKNTDEAMLTSTGIIARDPSALEDQKAIMEHTLRAQMDQMPHLGPVDRAKFDTHLTQVFKHQEMASLTSLAMTDPAAAKRLWDSGRLSHIDGSEGDRILKMGDAMGRQRRNDDHQQQMWADHEKDKADRLKFFQDGTYVGADGRINTKPGYIDDLIKRSMLPGGPSAAIIEEASRFARAPDEQSAPGAFFKAKEDFLSGKLSLSDLQHRVGAGGTDNIGKADYRFITEMDKLTPPEKQLMADFHTEARMRLGAQAKDIFGNVDPVGQHNLGQFDLWFQRATEEGRKQGKTLGQMLDQNSPDYIMKGQDWKQFIDVGKAVTDTIAGKFGAAQAEAASSGKTFWQRIRDLGEHGKPGDFNPKSGAEGEMQVVPGTARSPGYGIRGEDPNIPGDKERVGRDYADAMRIEFSGGDGTMTDALAAGAYNAGPGNMRAWLKTIGDPRNGEMTLGQFIQSIPFKETRDYIKRVAFGGQDISLLPAPAGSPAELERLRRIRDGSR